MNRFHFLAAIVVIGATATVAHAQRPAYTFTKIAEDAPTGGIKFFNHTPSLSNNGRVAFTATDNAGNIEGVYTGNGIGPAVAVAPATGTLTGIGAYVDINADGSRVAFKGRFGTGTGIYTASATTAGTLTSISTTTTGGEFSQFYDDFGPRLDGLGNVLYNDTPHPVLFNSFTNVRTAPADGTGAAQQTRFTPGSGVFAVRTGNTSVSDNGTLAYRGMRSETNSNTPEGIYVQPLSGSAVAVALTGTTFTRYDNLAVNNAGSVLYTGFGTGGIRLERYAGGITTSLLTTNN